MSPKLQATKELVISELVEVLREVQSKGADFLTPELHDRIDSVLDLGVSNSHRQIAYYESLSSPPPTARRMNPTPTLEEIRERLVGSNLHIFDLSDRNGMLFKVFRGKVFLSKHISLTSLNRHITGYLKCQPEPTQS